MEPRSNFPDETHIDDYDQRLDPFRDMYPFAITPLNRLVGVEGEAMLKAAHKKAAAEASKAEIAARQRGVSLAETMGVDYGNEDDDEDDDDSAAEKAKRRNESVKTTRQRSPFVDTAPTIDIPWASPLGTASRQRQITPEVELTEEQKALLPEYNAKSIKYKHMPSLAEYEMFGWDTERDDDVEAVAAEKQKEIDELNAEIRAGTAAQAAAAASAKGKAKTSSQKSADIGPSDKIPTKQSDEMGSAIPPKASAAASHSSDIAAKPSVKMPAMRFRQTAPWQPSSFGPRSSSSTAVQKTQRLMNTAPLAPYATDDDLASLKQGKNSWGPTGMAAGKKAVTTVAGGSEKSEKSTARRQAPAKITAKRTSQKAAIKSLQASSSVKRSSSTAAVEKPQPPMKKAALSVLSKAEIASLKPRRINRGPAGMAAGQKAPSATAGGSDKSKTTENASPEQSAGTTGEVVKANAETAVRAEGAVGGKQIAVVESEKGMGTKDTSADGQQSGERQKDEKEAAIRDQRGDDDDIEARLSRTLAAVGEDGWI